MSTDRLEILKMLSEGKINPEEAEMLLRARDEPSDAGKGPETEDSGPETGRRTFDRFTKVFSDVGREIENEVGKASESVRWQDIGKMVNDAVDQVASSVSDTRAGGGTRNRERHGGDLQEWTFDAAGIARIRAETANGSISLKGTDSERIVVRAWKAVHGRRSVTEDFEREVEVCAEQVGDELRVIAEHPTPPSGVNVVIRYEISTPRAVGVRLSTVQGSIKIQGTDGAVDAESVNGSVKLKLPSDFSGCIDAKTSNGRVRSDFPVAAERKSGGRLKGVIGEGGDAVVKLRSMNGSIHLKQQR